MRFTLMPGQADVAVTAYDFLPPGGTIGRSPDNDLVLPDPERAISRLQALVHVSAEGECRLTNQGSVTAVFHNDADVPRGAQIVLRHGDRLEIGHYQIVIGDPKEIADQQAQPDHDPLALFASLQDNHDDPLGLLHPIDIVAPESSHQLAAEALAQRVAHHTSARLTIDPESQPATDVASGRESSHDSATEQRLFTALLEGMGLDAGSGEQQLSEEQMRMTGRLLGLFSQGTVALLSSRSILKRGVKAEMTMILNEANNPFKLLPSGKTVLMQMYQSQMPGFMAPEQAARDALVDLQAHQLGMIAGIRAILAAMLQSFNPQRLEEQARRQGVLPRVGLSVSKKAALWDAFVRHYDETSGEVEDDFHTLFGEAFLQAYDMEVNQYKDSQIAKGG